MLWLWFVFVGSAVVLVYHLLAPTTHHFDQRRKMWCIGTSIKIFEFFFSLARSELKTGELHKLSLLVDLSCALFSAIWVELPNRRRLLHTPCPTSQLRPSWPAASEYLAARWPSETLTTPSRMSPLSAALLAVSISCHIGHNHNEAAQ